MNLTRLDRGEALKTKIDYLVQTWSFDLAGPPKGFLGYAGGLLVFDAG